MKIVLITDQIYMHGGIEKVLSLKANYWADVLLHDVIILTTENKNKEKCYSFSEKIKFVDLGIDYNRTISFFNIKNLVKVPTHFFKLKNKLKELKPDIVISCNYSYDFYFLNFINAKIPKIKEFHSSKYAEFQSPKSGLKDSILSFFSRIAEKKFSKLVVLNDDEKKFYHSEKVVVIPNPIHIPNFQSQLNSKTILAAGRISPVKNFGELIDIFSLLSKDFPEWELHFYGENYSNTKEELQYKINKLNLAHQIKILPPVEDLQKTMLNYSIYAMTSISECFPMVLLEAFSVGVPVISYDCPTGPRNIITNEEDGFLIRNKDQKEYLYYLKELMTKENLRIKIGNQAKKNILKFSNEQVMKKWNDLFLELCNV